MMYLKNDGLDAKCFFALELYALEELCAKDGCFMFWRTNPTLMIGRYQNTLKEINRAFAERQGIDIVRRISGGGTVYTDLGCWQFSFIVKRKSRQRIDFDEFTKPILDALKYLGVRNAARDGRNDLVIGGRKFSGNAQYIGKNGAIHHGTLLYNTNLDTLERALCVDKEKVESKGVESVRQRVTNIAEHMPTALSSEEFAEAMASYLTKEMTVHTLSGRDIEKALEIKRRQFDNWEWNFGHDPKSNITKEKRFAGGQLTVRLLIEDGRIANIRFFGDFFANEKLSAIEEGLIGCHYQKDEINRVLKKLNVQSVFYKLKTAEILSCII